MLMSGFWVDDRQLIQESKGLTMQSVGHVIVITTTTNAAYRTIDDDASDDDNDDNLSCQSDVFTQSIGHRKLPTPLTLTEDPLPLHDNNSSLML